MKKEENMNYEELMNELVDRLDMKHIPHDEPIKLFDGYKLTFPWSKGDVISHSYAYDAYETYKFSFDGGDVSAFSDVGELIDTIYDEYMEENI